MERRDFAKAAAAAVIVSNWATPGVAADPKPSPREFYELRTYVIQGSKLPLLDAYLKDALLPSLKRMGLGPVGVFDEVSRSERAILTGKVTDASPAKGNKRVLVLIVHRSPETVASLPGDLAADAAYVKAAAAFDAAKPDDPAYTGLMTSLLRAFAGMPKLEAPDPSKPRLFNLRVYQSHNDRAAAKKVEMFETEELAIFRRCGLTPVFFSSGFAGTGLPNIHYLLVFPDEAAREAAWRKFGADAAWKKLASMPEYADREIVSKILNVVLAPRPYSQI